MMSQRAASGTSSVLNWDGIDDVLIDMDGTLLDRHFDNFFFEEELPRRYAVMQGLSFEASRERLMAMYRSVEGELAWTDLHYWSGRVGIDVVAMHRELQHLIGFLPGAEDFLRAVRIKGKRLIVLTNAHDTGVAIKSAKTGLDRHVDRIVDAFEVGYLKMRTEYWPACRRLVGFDPSRSLYVDDAGVERVTDVGVAGIHRLLAVRDVLDAADCLVVVAGMDGALPSAVGGLTGVPLVAVPTSVGYGASFGGVAALLTMLNSCAPGVVVVNIDNGFGAGVFAARVARRVAPQPAPGTAT